MAIAIKAKLKSPEVSRTFSKNIKKYRTILVAACFFSSISLTTYAADKLEFEPESHRLERIRTIITQEKYRRLNNIEIHSKGNTSPSCGAMLDDLLNGNDFKPVEPAAILNSNYPVRSPFWNDEPTLKEEELIHEAERELWPWPWLSQSLQRCAREEADGDFHAFDHLAGAPPFRIYLLPEEINPFPESTLVYWSEMLENSDRGRTGYSWINLNSCTNTWGTNGMTNAMSLRADPLGQVSALTTYREWLATWTISRGFMFILEYYDFRAKAKNGQKIMNVCSWATYKEGT